MSNDKELTGFPSCSGFLISKYKVTNNLNVESNLAWIISEQ
jgi:hypothetical protein